MIETLIDLAIAGGKLIGVFLGGLGIFIVAGVAICFLAVVFRL